MSVQVHWCVCAGMELRDCLMRCLCRCVGVSVWVWACLCVQICECACACVWVRVQVCGCCLCRCVGVWVLSVQVCGCVGVVCAGVWVSVQVWSLHRCTGVFAYVWGDLNHIHIPLYIAITIFHPPLHSSLSFLTPSPQFVSSTAQVSSSVCVW